MMTSQKFKSLSTDLDKLQADHINMILEINTALEYKSSFIFGGRYVDIITIRKILDKYRKRGEINGKNKSY